MLHFMKAAVAASKPTRRSFLAMSAGTLGGLLIGARMPVQAQANMDEMVTPFVHIAPDSTVTVIVKHLDKGQGTATGLATLVAEELDAAAEQVTTDFAPANAEVYANLLFGIQGTGGSTAISNSFEQYRQAGATAKALLKAAAAEAWGVDVAEVSVAGGQVSAGANTASFGELAGRASQLTPPGEVALKAPEDWVYIGKSFPRVDVAGKTKGSVGMYGMDVQLDDMAVAVLTKPPLFGGTPKSVDATEALAVEGVLDVIELPMGVAVVARSTWPAIKARDLLEIEWDLSAAETRGTDELMESFAEAALGEGLPALVQGDAAAANERAAQVLEVEYRFPYLNHAQMEPIDITVLYDGESATFWTGSQIQTIDQGTAAAVLGLDPSKVAINTLWAGGSFGRRAIYDAHYTVEAAALGAAWLGKHGAPKPIKLIYTREDDVRGGYYRPLTVHRARIGLDAEGNIAGWQHHIVSQSITSGTAFEAFLVHDGVDHSTIEGINDSPYLSADVDLRVTHPQVGVKTLWWRSVGHTHTAYVAETLIDELAEMAGEDPVAFRLRHLDAHPRHRGVLELAAEKAGWSTPPAKGRFRGVAVHKSFESYVAEIAEVSLRDDGTVKVEKVVCAVDCGIPINPDNIRAQIEGGLGYGLSGILREELTMSDGEVDQWNYWDYQPLRITDMPEVEVHIVASTEAPTGIGEPGTPPIGPAVANAVARATGQRIRDLPFAKHGLA
ncbi:MAG: xanthine dehydrogenase family protein molybdopterin-binding subunit [Pseudomonadota bacterium]